MQDIITQYENYMIKIEGLFDGAEVPPDVIQFYLLCSLIADGFKIFYSRYNGAAIDADFASVGKQEYLGLGPLNQFERDSASLWNRHLRELEKRADQRKMYLAHN